MLSASRLDLSKLCPGSAALPQTRESTEVMRAGTARHVADLPALAAMLGPAAKVEVAYAFFSNSGRVRLLGYDIGRDYSGHGAEPWDMVGSADVVDGAAVYDYKSGDSWQRPPREHAQLRFLAMCAAKLAGTTEARVGIVRRLEDGQPPTVLVDKLDVFDLEAIEDEMLEIHAAHVAALAAIDLGQEPRLVVGEHCSRCRARWSCPAQARAAQQLAPLAARSEALTPETIAVAWSLCKAVGPAVKSVEDRVRDYVVDNGPVRLPDGRELRAREVERKGYAVEATKFVQVVAGKAKS